MFSSDVKYYHKLLLRLHEYSQERNFPSYFMCKLEEYKAEELRLFFQPGGWVHLTPSCSLFKRNCCL